MGNGIVCVCVVSLPSIDNAYKLHYVRNHHTSFYNVAIVYRAFNDLNSTFALFIHINEVYVCFASIHVEIFLFLQ